MPSITVRRSVGGRPVLGRGGSRGRRRFHCSSVQIARISHPQLVPEMRRNVSRYCVAPESLCSKDLRQVSWTLNRVFVHALRLGERISDPPATRSRSGYRGFDAFDLYFRSKDDISGCPRSLATAMAVCPFLVLALGSAPFDRSNSTTAR